MRIACSVFIFMFPPACVGANIATGSMPEARYNKTLCIIPYLPSQYIWIRDDSLPHKRLSFSTKRMSRPPTFVGGFLLRQESSLRRMCSGARYVMLGANKFQSITKVGETGFLGPKSRLFWVNQADEKAINTRLLAPLFYRKTDFMDNQPPPQKILTIVVSRPGVMRQAALSPSPSLTASTPMLIRLTGIFNPANGVLLVSEK